jgi:hypothetical protein
MPGFYTHQQALVAAVMRSSSNEPVLELGVGEFSTPILHEICAAQGRYLRTLTEDPEWYNRYKQFAVPGRHDIHLLSGGRTLTTWRQNAWALKPPAPDPRFNNDQIWEVVFVDQAPGNARVWSIEELRQDAVIFVVHDTEAYGHYGYGPCFEKFKHVKHYQRIKPYTTVLSDWENFESW